MEYFTTYIYKSFDSLDVLNIILLAITNMQITLLYKPSIFCLKYTEICFQINSFRVSDVYMRQ